MAAPHTLAPLSSMGAVGRSHAAGLAPRASIGGSVGSEEGTRRARALCVSSHGHAARPTTGGRKPSAARSRVVPWRLLRWAPQHRCAHGRQSHAPTRGLSRPSATHLVRRRAPLVRARQQPGWLYRGRGLPRGAPALAAGANWAISGLAACCYAPAPPPRGRCEISLRGWRWRHVVRARVAAVAADGSDTSTAEELSAAMEDVIQSGFALGADAPAMNEEQVAEVKRKLEVAGSLLEQALAARMVLEVRRPVPLSSRATPHALRPGPALTVRTRRRVLRPGGVRAPTKRGDSEFHQITTLLVFPRPTALTPRVPPPTARHLEFSEPAEAA